jgi:SpoVK/Ycf46/Vps4 family AAA+-type ATPase
VGETEKNLSLLMTRAEESEVLLLFDEADSLFGKRTDIKDANDRFANAQTNYLLQRMESFNGIAVLTSNTAARFDTAFSRRFDMILEFPLPGAEERRELWCAHLGGNHQLSDSDLNRIAVAADLTGGQIRNAVLSAAVTAQSRGAAIALDDILLGLKSEYRKLGRQLPDELRVTFPHR